MGLQKVLLLDMVMLWFVYRLRLSKWVLFAAPDPHNLRDHTPPALNAFGVSGVL